MYGGTTREDPEYPGILSIPDTVSVRLYVWGDNSGSWIPSCPPMILDPEYPGIFSIPDTVSCEVVCMGGQVGRIPRHCVCEGVCMGGQLGRIPRIPGYLVFRTYSGHCVRNTMYGGTTREDPKYPGILV